jgi:hydrogenase expression/formation protein HypE
MPEPIITAAHGGGGSATGELIALVRRHLDNPILARFDDGACLDMQGTALVFTTDSYVVEPLEFNGGDIGTLAVCGTVNDIAMQGGRPKYLSLSLILEEGLSFARLERILASIATAARAADVTIVTGDTKVVQHGRAGGMYINTAGVGERYPNADTHIRNARPADAVIVTGSLGDHGIAVMNAREELGLHSDLESDVAPLHDLAGQVCTRADAVHCMRDLTRGGLAAALCDIAETAGVGITIDEAALPVKRQVRGACDLLGLDVLEVANEAKAVIVCPAACADQVVSLCRQTAVGAHTCVVGTVEDAHHGTVLCNTREGGQRIVSMPRGEHLPRIC